ncbi:unnamed protein product [Coccothraustes coccothraustes]
MLRGKETRDPRLQAAPKPQRCLSPVTPILGESRSPATPAAEPFTRGSGKPSRPFVHLAGFLLAQAIGKGKKIIKVNATTTKY